ncbi:MAG: tetratricopeptide repeat protein, partial [Desulfomonilaceae bacterium]
IKNLKDAIAMNKNGIVAQKALGEVYEANKDYGKALDVYLKLRTTLAKKGETGDIDKRIDRLRNSYVSELYNQGLEDYRLGNAKHALAIWATGLKLDPNNLQILRDRGLTYYRLGQYQKALDDFNHAVEIGPGQAEIYRVRGDTYYKLKKADKAVDDYRKAIEMNPSDAICYNNLGLVFHETGDLDRALEDYSKAISIDPSNPSFYENRALVYLAKHDNIHAAEDYKMALNLTDDQKAREIISQKIASLTSQAGLNPDLPVPEPNAASVNQRGGSVRDTRPGW